MYMNKIRLYPPGMFYRTPVIYPSDGVVFSACRPDLFLGHLPKLVFSAFASPLALWSLAHGQS